MSTTESPEPSADLWFERSNFAGCLLGGVAYGMHVCVFCATLYFIHRHRTRSAGADPDSKREPDLALVPRERLGLPAWLSIYTWVMFALGTIQVGTNTRFYEQMWIDDRGIEGGPIAWITEHFDTPVNVLGSCAYIIANFLADGLLIYRMLMVWNNNLLVAVLPVLCFLASTVLGALTVFQTAQPGASLWTNATIQIAVPYWALTIATNALITLTIVARLLLLRRAVHDAFASGSGNRGQGGKGADMGLAHTRTYTTAMAVFVESSALYTVVGLIYIITYGRNSNVQNIVLPIQDQIVCISPELIVMRMALDCGWTRDVAARTARYQSRMPLLRSWVGGTTSIATGVGTGAGTRTARSASALDRSGTDASKDGDDTTGGTAAAIELTMVGGGRNAEVV